MQEKVVVNYDHFLPLTFVTVKIFHIADLILTKSDKWLGNKTREWLKKSTQENELQRVTETNW